LKLSDASITTILGMRGCGKSVLTHKLSQQHKRKIVFDVNKEWNGNYSYANNIDDFNNLFRKQFHQSEFTIVIRFQFGTPVDEMQSLAAQISSTVFSVGEKSELHTCLIFEESQFYFPNSGLRPELFSLITVGRHGFIDVIANTQRPAQVSKALISQSHDLYIGQIFEFNDMKYLAGTLGPSVLDAEKLEKGEFIHYRAGEGALQIVQLF